MPDKMITINLTLYRELMEDREWLKHLKKEAYDTEEAHYDECEILNIEIAALKQRLLMRGVN